MPKGYLHVGAQAEQDDRSALRSRQTLLQSATHQPTVTGEPNQRARTDLLVPLAAPRRNVYIIDRDVHPCSVPIPTTEPRATLQEFPRTRHARRRIRRPLPRLSNPRPHFARLRYARRRRLKARPECGRPRADGASAVGGLRVRGEFDVRLERREQRAGLSLGRGAVAREDVVDEPPRASRAGGGQRREGVRKDAQVVGGGAGGAGDALRVAVPGKGNRVDAAREADVLCSERGKTVRGLWMRR